ncbi:MAG: hypothetical protein ACLR17_06040 [Enterobacteriaceae bacterium]
MRMDACSSAVRHGILRLPQRCGITPINPLFTGWCAVNAADPGAYWAKRKNLRRSSAAHDDPRRGADEWTI